MTHNVKQLQMQVKLQALKFCELSMNQLQLLWLMDWKTKLRKKSLFMISVEGPSTFQFLKLVRGFLKSKVQTAIPTWVVMTSTKKLSTGWQKNSKMRMELTFAMIQWLSNVLGMKQKRRNANCQLHSKQKLTCLSSQLTQAVPNT